MAKATYGSRQKKIMTVILLIAFGIGGYFRIGSEQWKNIHHGLIKYILLHGDIFRSF